MTDLRNKTAHGQWSDFNKDDVKEMVGALRRLMEEHFAQPIRIESTIKP